MNLLKITIYCSIIVSHVFCSVVDDFIEEECAEVIYEISDKEYEDIIEYLMTNYRDHIKEYPGLYEYYEHELKDIHDRKKE